MLFVRSLVPAKVRGHEFDFVVYFSDILYNYFPVSFWTFVPNSTITLTLTHNATPKLPRETPLVLYAGRHCGLRVLCSVVDIPQESGDHKFSFPNGTL